MIVGSQQVELLGRIRERFNVDAGVLKVTQEQSINALAMMVWKVMQRADVALSHDVGVDQDDDSRCEGVFLDEKSDIVGAMTSIFLDLDEEQQQQQQQQHGSQHLSKTGITNAVKQAVIKKIKGQKKTSKLLFGATG